jgi:HTH-type transcriptional regulator / antitoxin HigA
MNITPLSDHQDYFDAVEAVEALLGKATAGGGFNSLSAEETMNLQTLSLQLAAYEKQIKLMPLQTPLSLPEMIGVKMVQFRLNQKGLAQLLSIPESRISEILNGKRKINISLAKALHEKLGIGADFILETA